MLASTRLYSLYADSSKVLILNRFKGRFDGGKLPTVPASGGRACGMRRPCTATYGRCRRGFRVSVQLSDVRRLGRRSADDEVQDVQLPVRAQRGRLRRLSALLPQVQRVQERPHVHPVPEQDHHDAGRHLRTYVAAVICLLRPISLKMRHTFTRTHPVEAHRPVVTYLQFPIQVCFPCNDHAQPATPT